MKDVISIGLVTIAIGLILYLFISSWALIIIIGGAVAIFIAHILIKQK